MVRETVGLLESLVPPTAPTPTHPQCHVCRCKSLSLLEMEFSWNIFQARQCGFVFHVESLWRPPHGPAVVLSSAVGPMRGNFLVSKFSVSSGLISSSAAAFPRVKKSSTKHTYRLEAKRQKDRHSNTYWPRHGSYMYFNARHQR